MKKVSPTHPCKDPTWTTHNPVEKSGKKIFFVDTLTPRQLDIFIFFVSS